MCRETGFDAVYFSCHGMLGEGVQDIMAASRLEPAGIRLDAYPRPSHGDAMTKAELVQQLTERNPHLTRGDVEIIVATIFKEIVTALCRSDRVEIRGFGAFSVKRQDPRIGRDPRTGVGINVAEKHTPRFKPGKLIRDRLN
jgi:integration host factor subunit beta